MGHFESNEGETFLEKEYCDVVDSIEDKKSFKARMRAKLRTAAALEDSGLRLNQLAAIKGLLEKLDDDDWNLRGYFIQPTGAGKTVLFGSIAKALNIPTLIFVPKINLLQQTKNELINNCGFEESDIGIIGDNQRCFGNLVTIITYQSHLSLQENVEYQKLLKTIELKICDEAHKSLGNKTSKTFIDDYDGFSEGGVHTDLYDDNMEVDDDDLSDTDVEAEDFVLENNLKKNGKNCLTLAFTATPQLSKKHLKDVFGDIEIARESYINLIRAKNLVPFKIFHTEGTIILGEDVDVLKNLTQEQESKILDRENTYDKLLEKYSNEYIKHPNGFRGAVFCVNISECDKFIDKAESKYGLKCKRVTSNDEAEALNKAEMDLSERKIDLIVTVDRLTEGWNFPMLDAIIMARANSSPARLIQAAGRGARTYVKGGKEFNHLFETNWTVKYRSDDYSEEGDSVGNNDEFEENEGSNVGSFSLRKSINIMEALLLNGEHYENLGFICVDSEGLPISNYEVMNRSNFPRDYFSKREKVEFDLLAFVKECGFGSITELTISKVNLAKKSKVSLGFVIKFRNYLNKAMRRLNCKCAGEALDKLKWLCGVKNEVKERKKFIRFPDGYFKDKKMVLFDLVSFVKACGLTAIDELNIGSDSFSKSAVVNLGVSLSLKKYLYHAMKEYNCSSFALTLDTLKGLCFDKIVERKERCDVKFPEGYFLNNATVIYDLGQFAKVCGFNSIEELTTTNFTNKAEISLGKMVSLEFYLKKLKNEIGAKSMADALYKAKERCGINYRERSLINFPLNYFKNREIVERELIKYAKACGLNTIEELSTSSFYVSVEVDLDIGRKVKFQTFLHHAKREFECSTVANALFELKKLCLDNVVEKRDFIKVKFPNGYFMDREIMMNDLMAFTNACGLCSIDNLALSNVFSVVEAEISLGVKVKFQRFLDNARKTLKIKSMAETLKFLKEFVK